METEPEKQSAFSRLLLVFLVTGLVLRFICAPLLTYDYDMYHWAVIMQNIDSGNRLYELTGYFYTPVWGYIMGAVLMIWNTFFTIDVFGMKFTSFLGIEDMEHIYHISTVTSPEFNLAMKIPLILVDLLVGYLIYKIVKQYTNDGKKADIAFGLWFLCPIVLYMSGIQGMFDNISALLILLCIMLIIKDDYFLGGFIFSLAVLLKMFPGACAFILILYVIKKYPERREACTRLSLAVIGGISAIIAVMIPNIINGDFAQTVTMITDRSDRFGLLGLLPYILGIVLELLIAYRFSKETSDDIDRKLTIYITYATVCSMLFAYAPQYAIVAIPFIVISIMFDDRYRLCWVLVGAGAFISALALNNFSLLSSISAYWNIIPANVIIDLMNGFEAGVLGISWEFVLNAIGFVIEYIGLILIVMMAFERELVERFPPLSSFFKFIWRESDA